MKVATIIVRMLMGALFVFASTAYFFDLVPQPPLEGDMKTFREGLDAAGYLMPTVKTVELLCGLAFLSGFFVPLASVVITPVIVNIVGVHVFLDPAGLPVAIFLVGANGFLAYRFRDTYRTLFRPS